MSGNNGDMANYAVRARHTQINSHIMLVFFGKFLFSFIFILMCVSFIIANFCLIWKNHFYLPFILMSATLYLH